MKPDLCTEFGLVKHNRGVVFGSITNRLLYQLSYVGLRSILGERQA
jgi:hypothetical protein